MKPNTGNLDPNKALCDSIAKAQVPEKSYAEILKRK